MYFLGWGSLVWLWLSVFNAPVSIAEHYLLKHVIAGTVVMAVWTAYNIYRMKNPVKGKSANHYSFGKGKDLRSLLDGMKNKSNGM